LCVFVDTFFLCLGGQNQFAPLSNNRANAKVVPLFDTVLFKLLPESILRLNNILQYSNLLAIRDQYEQKA
jgi:hypothetical protein